MKNWNKIPSRGIGFAIVALIGFQTQSALAQEAVTYAGEVAGIINENCVICHREGGVGPMALTSYEEVRPWAPLIQLRVANREMPPYAYDHDIGIQELQGDWRLTEAQIEVGSGLG